MIREIYFGKDIHTSKEDTVLYAMNTELGDSDKGVSLRYGFVQAAMQKGLLSNLKNINKAELGDIIKSMGQRNPDDGIYRDYHGIVCHSILNDNIGWRLAPEIIKDTLDTHYNGQHVASLFMGTGIVGQVGKADIMAIMKAINDSKADVSLYTLGGYGEMQAIQRGLKKKGINTEEVDENYNKGGRTIDFIPLIINPYHIQATH